MKNRCWRAGVLFLAGVAGLNAATAAPRFIEVTSGDYRIVGDIAESRALEYLEHLRRYRQLMETLLDREVAPGALPVHVLVVSRGEWKTVRSSAGISALLYADNGIARVAVDGSKSSSSPLQPVQHALTHHFIRAQSRLEYPLWFIDGLAVIVREASFEGNKATLGLPVDLLRYLRFAGHWIQIERVLAADAAAVKRMDAMSFYAGAWAMMHYGIMADPEFGRRTTPYLRARREGKSLEAAVFENFDMGVRELDDMIRSYAYRDSLPEGTVTLPELAAEQVRVRTLDETASTLEVVIFVSGRDPKNKKLAPLLDGILKRQPAHPLALVLRALAAEHSGDADTADDFVARAEKAIRPADVRAAVAMGRALHLRASRSPASAPQIIAKARAWYEQAMLVEPEDREAALGFAVTSIMAGVEVPRALSIIKKACASGFRDAGCVRAQAIARWHLSAHP